MSAHDVFLVEHAHVFKDGEEDVKTIGIYSSKEEALNAIERLRQQPGFREAPEGFTVDLYRLNQGSWNEGYVTHFHSSE